jgi:hypothetical protein
MDMSIMKNVTEGIYPFQLTPYQKVMSDGFKQDTMSLFFAGRQTGKSQLNYYYSKFRNKNLCKEIFLPMTPEPKYKFSRSKWYIAEFNWGQQTEVLEWCTQQFGSQPENPDAWSRWCHRSWTEIHFRDEKDYEWFILRWS